MRSLIALTLVALGGAGTLVFNRAATKLHARGGTGTALAYLGASFALMAWCMWCAYWIFYSAEG